jgi:GPH family glycoside/pentoside/hexuronide:cation symporter
MLADPEIDTVEILTPHRLHEVMVVDAARAGKHIALQKPMTISLHLMADGDAAEMRYGVSFSLITMFFTGIGFTYAIPYAMVPDAIEYDFLKTGERSEGAFTGIWTFGIKIGQAVALGISGGILSLSGYIPDVTQTPQALLGIRVLLGPIPAVIFFLALITLYCYPINEAHYKEILDGIRKMESRSN